MATVAGVCPSLSPSVLRAFSSTGHQHAHCEIVPTGTLHFITPQAPQKRKQWPVQTRCRVF